MKKLLIAIALTLGFTALYCSNNAIAEDTADAEKTQNTETEESVDLTYAKRVTPSGQYIDPASFFRFHGYVTLTYTEPGRQIGAPGNQNAQILIPRASSRSGSNEGGFYNDAALFVGAEPFENVGAIIEIHFVGNAVTPVMTEAKVTWDLIDDDSPQPYRLRLSGGRFWWPFGIHNSEWFSAVNQFPVVSPAALQVVPAHYNELGAMIEGELALNENMALNMVVSGGNGAASFEISDNVGLSTIGESNTSDNNRGRTWTSRIGLVYKDNNKRVELGLSGSTGSMRSGAIAGPPGGLPLPSPPLPSPAIDPRTLAAEFTAFGPDLSINWGNFDLRSYFYRSRESLKGALDIDRSGLTIEPSYTMDVSNQALGKWVKNVALVGRFSYADEELPLALGVANTRPVARYVQYGPSLNVRIRKHFISRIGYVWHQESKAAPNFDDNLFFINFTGEF